MKSYPIKLLLVLLLALGIAGCKAKNDPSPSQNPNTQNWGYLVLNGARTDFTFGLIQAASSPYYIAAHNHLGSTTQKYQVTAFFSGRPAAGQYDCVFSHAPGAGQVYLAISDGNTGSLRYAATGTKATVTEASGKLQIAYNGRGTDAAGTGDLQAEVQILER